MNLNELKTAAARYAREEMGHEDVRVMDALVRDGEGLVLLFAKNVGDWTMLLVDDRGWEVEHDSLDADDFHRNARETER